MGNKKKKKKHKEMNKAVCPEEQVTQVIPVLPDVTEERVLSPEEEDDILDAKIRAGINEAAEEFKQDLEIEAVGDEIADEMKAMPPETTEEIQTAEDKPEEPATVVQRAATEEPEAPMVIPEEPAQDMTEEPEAPMAVQRAMTEASETAAEQETAAEIKKEEKTMEEKRTMNGQEERTEAEVKTVYIKEKQSVGWWKIVMLVLASVVTLCFVVTACFAGTLVRELKILSLAGAAYSIEDSYRDHSYGNGFEPYDSYDNGQGSYNGDDSYDSFDNYEDFWNYFNNENSRTENSEDNSSANDQKQPAPEEKQEGKQEEGSSDQNSTEEKESDTEAMKDLINGLFGIIDGLGIR